MSGTFTSVNIAICCFNAIWCILYQRCGVINKKAKYGGTNLTNTIIIQSAPETTRGN